MGLGLTISNIHAMCQARALDIDPNPPVHTCQARALGIDLNPRVVGSTEDVPTYEGAAAARPQQQQQQQLQMPVAQLHSGSYMNYPPYNMGGAPQQQQQQQQHPFAQQQQQQYQRPMSAQAAGRPPMKQGAHPFEAPGQYPPAQQRQQKPAGPMAHPFALDAANNDPWDRMADDIHRMQIGTAEFNK